MLKDALFAEETTPEDLVLAQALLAERSAEDIAAALARLYRARLPSARGHHRSRRASQPGPRGSAVANGTARPPRGDDRTAGPRSKSKKPSARHGMGEGGVWFRASIGSRKNAEARWLLPMICRRGGIDKTDIGAIRVMDTTTEFEISARAGEILCSRKSAVPTRKTISASRRCPKGRKWCRRRPKSGRIRPARVMVPVPHDRPARRASAEAPHGKPWEK